MDFKKSLFFILCLLAVFASCSPEPKQEEAKIVTTNISVPSLFEVEEGQELIIPLRGVTNIVATDKVLLRDVAENEFVCDITDLKDGSRMAFRLPEKIAGGYYKFYIKRGDINYYVAAFTLNVMKSLVVEPGEGVNIYGIVTCDGEGVKDVLVSDGEEIVKTDENGIYQLKSNKNWMYVFVIIPSGYEVPTQGVLPQLSATLTQAVDMPERRDFELIKSDNENFTMFVLGDMHLANRNGDLGQFTGVANTLNNSISKAPGKRYCLTLGDMTWDVYWYSNSYTFPE